MADKINTLKNKIAFAINNKKTRSITTTSKLIRDGQIKVGKVLSENVINKNVNTVYFSTLTLK